MIQEMLINEPITEKREVEPGEVLQEKKMSDVDPLDTGDRGTMQDDVGELGMVEAILIAKAAPGLEKGEEGEGDEEDEPGFEALNT